MDVKHVTTKQMVEDMGHCGNIATSALVLADERSRDIDVPCMITFMLLKKLCEANIEEAKQIKIPKAAQMVAEMLGKDVDTLREDAFRNMEALIDEFFKTKGIVMKIDT